jgi:hypothetical protein
MKQWQFQTLQLCARSMQNHEELLCLIDEFRKAGIRILLYKGLVIGKLYPDPHLRTMGDADLLVREEDHDVAVELLRQNGYIKTEENEEKKYSYFISPGGLVVDLQTKVWNYYSKRDIALSEMIEETAWSNTVLIPVDGKEIPTLGVQEHLFCIICHAAKHFISQGIGIRHLADIALYVNRYYDVIDWQDMLSKLTKIKLDTFLVSIMHISVNYFGMRNIPVVGHSGINNDSVNQLLEDCIDAGVFGKRNEKRQFSGNGGGAFYFRNSKTRLGIFLSTAFPSTSFLGSRYDYAKKCRILLPVAWLHRGLRYLLKKDRLSQSMSIFEMSDISSERMQLLTQLEIL